MDKHFLKSGAILILVGFSQLISAQTKIEIVSIENAPIISKYIRPFCRTFGQMYL